MGALCSVTAIIAAVIPFAQGLGVLGTVPMGLLAYRFRPRVLIASAVAATIIAFLISGLGSSAMVVDAAWVGGICGIVKRKGRGVPTVIAASLVAGFIWGAAWVAVFAVLTRLRQLIFGVLTANVNGVAAFLRWVHLPQVGETLKRWVAEGLQYWPWLVLPYLVFVVVLVTLIGWSALSRLLERMGDIPDVHKLDPPDTEVPEDAGIGPVPVRLDRVRFRYPNAAKDALREVSLEVRGGEHVAITGANGSGKTTLMLILAGRKPTSGTVHRPGTVGLGELGGTALVLQHPKSQVLGTRVADDVVWGLPPDAKVDVSRLLREVGLDDLAESDTASLSGGQLQRLALAAALAREPALLIADEVTSMIDQKGRDGLLSVMSGLTERHRTALVHITHFDDEAATADHTINLSESSDNATAVGIADAPAPSPAVPHRHNAGAIELVGVGHEYASGTPWAKTALRDINFVAEQGDGVLIHGDNGSGKSTLGWIMAGLTVPTTGSCLIDGEPTDEHVGVVALAFQSARLQLMRSHVNLEVASAAGFSHHDEDRVAAALGLVGLQPALAQRRIDQLSGGQMRRVVLAGLLARSPRALILDEPLAGLDIASQRGLLTLLERLRREQGLTLVVISHDSVGLEGICPRTLHLHDGVLETVPTTTGGVA
ncbi:cobalt ABC transporter ATP-binding protein [Mycobacterium florentinum]|uniref:Cobalt ABC transporter ATP-binding protein n=2 Tax=Mycobacterium florentinum TaxID=292462 RepID=A0A1X1UBP2_MYCFL|nr:ATP-binding cassette domain-containing protein [Mycobacterium florentinum]ORV54253.1 cobalt ABC transporter ATP-binding protein [Mycobacterium florentinum]BBX81628.1 putative ABC transporter ATP-binding protein [Mycobacterium florentinum]